MKEDIRLVEIQLPEDSEIIEALRASRNAEKNINNIELSLYLGKGKKPLKIILRPKAGSLEFDVATPFYYPYLKMKEEARIGKAQIRIGEAQITKALPIRIQVESENLTNLYSLSIEMDEEYTDPVEYFIEKIKVLKDELGVARETLRLTGDILHILPSAKKRFNIVKNKINSEQIGCSNCGETKNIEIDWWNTDNRYVCKVCYTGWQKEEQPAATEVKSKKEEIESLLREVESLLNQKYKLPVDLKILVFNYLKRAYKQAIEGDLYLKLERDLTNKISSSDFSRKLKTTTGDIPTRELCDSREKKSSSTENNKIDSSLCQKEDNPLILYLDVPVAKSILLPKTLESLKEWKKILSIKPISIPFSGDLKIGHVSSFVYKAHSPRAGDCTYEVVAKCEINNTAAKEIISNFEINPNLLGPTIRVSIVKSLEKAYLDYITEQRIAEPYPHPIRYTDCSINKKIDKYADSTVMTFVTNFLDAYDYTNIINGSSNYSINIQLEKMIFQGEVFCAEIEGVEDKWLGGVMKPSGKIHTYIPRVLLRARVSSNCKNAIMSITKNKGTIHSSIGKLVKKEMFNSETKLVGTVFIHKTSFMDY